MTIQSEIFSRRTYQVTVDKKAHDELYSNESRPIRRPCKKILEIDNIMADRRDNAELDKMELENL